MFATNNINMDVLNYHGSDDLWLYVNGHVICAAEHFLNFNSYFYVLHLVSILIILYNLWLMFCLYTKFN
jgi:hypothetical protein